MFRICYTSKMNDKMVGETEIAVLGGGCFWCLEAVFQRLPGVVAVVSGYAGGDSPNPTYKQICRGDTGHAEVIQAEFRPSAVSYAEILDAFWRAHDPTTLNRQGADSGTQYRSIILTASEEQAKIAADSKNAAQKYFRSPIVTEIAPLKKFWEAEREHQDFYNRNAGHPYCIYNIVPKLQKLGM